MVKSNVPAQKSTGIVRSDGIADSRLVDPGDPNPLGACNEAQLETVLIEKLGEDPALDDSELFIAAQALAEALYIRMKHPDATSDPEAPIIVLVSSRAKELAKGIGAVVEPVLNDGSCCLSGYLWITTPALASGYKLSLTGSTPNQLFAQISTLNLGYLPALYVHPSATVPEIRCYPNGMESPDTVIRIRLLLDELSIGYLDQILSDWHSSFRTPDAGCGGHTPWKESRKYVPRPKTEEFLQGSLQQTLRVALLQKKKYRIQFEVPGDEGRCDLLIKSKHPTVNNCWVYDAVFELKVLRSLDAGENPVSKSSNKDAIDKGVNQAISYKDENDARMGLLCCFDLRKPDHCDGEICLDAVRPLAQRHSIELRIFRVYGSADDFRRERSLSPA
ncbi:hypothetical protein [Rhodocista pekingensis]|uniref:Uncharacterized protein n=1 Tax=Rhodocista pekingensis TaxID=201185 RepID=A0ABW2KZF0_9PROT